MLDVEDTGAEGRSCDSLASTPRHHHSISLRKQAEKYFSRRVQT